jgi:hypothetical protein
MLCQIGQTVTLAKKDQGVLDVRQLRSYFGRERGNKQQYSVEYIAVFLPVMKQQ